jgi:amino-acid N-acetyltransferase
MDEQVVKITDLSPQLEMELHDLIGVLDLSTDVLKDLELFARFDSNGRVQGFAGLREFDEACLLVLVVVRENSRGKGIGSALVSHILWHYAGKVEQMYLVTKTAEDFFQRFGFRKTAIDKLPQNIADTEGLESLFSPEALMMSLSLPRSWSMT